MATFINTGSAKCRVLNLLECPICQDEFENIEGVFVDSSTIGDKVLVCNKHKDPLTADDEVGIQNALRSAIDTPRGYVLAKGKLVKKFNLFDKYADKYTKSLKL